MPLRSLLLGLIVAAAVAAALASRDDCSRDDIPCQRTENAENGKGPVVVGAAWPWEARKNVLYWEGMQMAVEEVNAAGGVLGRPLSILRMDDHEDVDQGRQIAQRFGSNPDVVAVIGHLQSYVTVPAAAVYDLSGLVLISATATSNELTAHNYHRVFRTIFTDDADGKSMAEYALAHGYRRPAIYYSRDEYGRGLANAFEETIVEGGGQVADRRSYDPNAPANPAGAQQTAEAWVTLRPDAVFLAGQDEPAGLLVAELRRRGIDAPLLGSDAIGTPGYTERAGAAAEGTVIAAPFHRDDPSPQARRFTEAFRRRYNRNPDVAAALAYDAVHVLVEGMKLANSVAPERVAPALHTLTGFPGVTGSLSFDAAGNLAGAPVGKVVVRNGEFHHLTEDAPASPAPAPPASP